MVDVAMLVATGGTFLVKGECWCCGSTKIDPPSVFVNRLFPCHSHHGGTRVDKNLIRVLSVLYEAFTVYPRVQ